MPAVTLGFVVLRAVNLYGDPAPWTAQATWLATVLSFLNCEKYPPSLLYLMMTLGPALMLLAAFEHARGRLARVLATFGQVPFFFYVVHIYLIHALAVAAGLAIDRHAREQSRDRAQPCRHLSDLAARAGAALSGLPLVRRAQAARRVVELSLTLYRTVLS